jgi:hypothetical protein
MTTIKFLCTCTNGPFGTICNERIPETSQAQPSFVKHGFESNNNPDTPKCISIIKLPNDKWQAECRQDSKKDDDEEKNDTVNIGKPHS